MAAITKELASQLAFNPDWVIDPVPWHIVQHLDEKTIVDLAQVHLEAHKSILTARVKAIGDAQEILKRAAPRMR